MIPVLADAIHLLANKRSPWRRRWRKVGEEKPPVRGVSRPWSFLAGTKQRRQVRKQCAATTLIEFVSFSRGAASPFWNASSPRPAFPARTRERERAQRRKEEKGGNGHTSLEHRRGERKSMVPVKVPEVLQTGEEVDDACLRYSALNLNNRLNHLPLFGF